MASMWVHSTLPRRNFSIDAIIVLLFTLVIEVTMSHAIRLLLWLYVRTLAVEGGVYLECECADL